MGFFHLGGMTISSVFKKPETVCYPAQTKAVPEGLKGHIENDPDACILCGICMRNCPAHAIRVDRAQRLWECDGFLCVQCFQCVRDCPKSSLSMKSAYTHPSTKKNTVQCIIQEKPKGVKPAK